MCMSDLSFADCLRGDTHAEWATLALPCGVLSLRATTHRDMESHCEAKAVWVTVFVHSVGFAGMTAELLEIAAYYYVVEKLRLDVAAIRFIWSEPVLHTSTTTISVRAGNRTRYLGPHDEGCGLYTTTMQKAILVVPSSTTAVPICRPN